MLPQGSHKHEKAESLAKYKVKSHLSVIIKHHKEEGNKGRKDAENNIGTEKGSVLAEKSPEKALHTDIKKADGHTDAHT